MGENQSLDRRVRRVDLDSWRTVRVDRANIRKSYVQLEYEYAIEKKKPFFTMVVSKEHHEQRVKEIGLTVDERENQQKYKEFRGMVTQRLCGFWNDMKDM
jgi:hypothetical protein